MGLLDDAVPSGNIAKPLLVALGVLLAGKMFAGKSRTDDADDAAAPEQVPDRRSPQFDTPASRDAGPAGRQTQADAQPAGRGGGGILDGLGDLLDNLAKNGQKETADSWVKPDTQNQPIEPTDLGKAIGQRTLSEIARQTGMSEDDLLKQLSKVLPGVVDKLTPAGRVPSNREVAENFPSNPW